MALKYGWTRHVCIILRKLEVNSDCLGSFEFPALSSRSQSIGLPAFEKIYDKHFLSYILWSTEYLRMGIIVELENTLKNNNQGAGVYGGGWKNRSHILMSYCHTFTR